VKFAVNIVSQGSGTSNNYAVKCAYIRKVGSYFRVRINGFNSTGVIF